MLLCTKIPCCPDFEISFIHAIQNILSRCLLTYIAQYVRLLVHFFFFLNRVLLLLQIWKHWRVLIATSLTRKHQFARVNLMRKCFLNILFYFHISKWFFFHWLDEVDIYKAVLLIFNFVFPLFIYFFEILSLLKLVPKVRKS